MRERASSDVNLFSLGGGRGGFVSLWPSRHSGAAAAELMTVGESRFASDTSLASSGNFLFLVANVDMVTSQSSWMARASGFGIPSPCAHLILISIILIIIDCKFNKIYSLLKYKILTLLEVFMVEEHFPADD